MMSTHMMAIRSPQNVHKICFLVILMTFICDVKNYHTMPEPHCVKYCMKLHSLLV